jgi:hypothetical protein
MLLVGDAILPAEAQVSRRSLACTSWAVEPQAAAYATAAPSVSLSALFEISVRVPQSGQRTRRQQSRHAPDQRSFVSAPCLLATSNLPVTAAS